MRGLAQPMQVLGVAGVAAALSMAVGQAQGNSNEALLSALQRGGHVLVMRHASSPRELPDKLTANPDNLKLERQLDSVGRTGATAFGNALRALNIPVGEVLSSPAYRTLETVRLAKLPAPRSFEELGEGGQNMDQAGTESQAVWLRDRVTRFPEGTNTLIVTHMPNLTRAFPAWAPVAEGEVVIVGPAAGAARPLGRIRIDEWPGLARR